MSVERAVERACELKTRIATHKFDLDALRVARDTLVEIARSGRDLRAREHAAEFLFKHDWQVLEYENPPVQKHEISGTVQVATIVVESVKPNADGTANQST